MSIKLCYIFTSAGLKSDSVQRKVMAQINGLNACGVECRGAFFTTEVSEVTRYSENIELIPYPLTTKRYFNIITQKRQLIKSVSSYIKRTINPDEYLYVRYPGVNHELYKFAKDYPFKIISEHQAKEIDEIRSAKNEHPLGLNLSKLISYFLYQVWPIYNEVMWSRPYSKHLLAKVAVTNEIGRYQRQNCKNVWVIPNGIETSNFKVRQVPQFNNELRILFLKGTSSMAPWNGLDRLIRSIDLFQSATIKITLIICGNIIEGEIPERSYIFKKGYLNNEELDQLFSSVTIGFSTLCLFRKNLNEAAVLKAREYFSRGLPFVYAYEDPDISVGDEVNKYAFQLPNDNSDIDFDQIVKFAKEVSKDVLHPQKMRKFAEEKLDWKAKMNLLKEDLFKQIAMNK